MTFEEVKKTKKMIRTALICLVLGVLLVGARVVISDITEEAIGAANELTTIGAQVSSTTAELNALNESIEASHKVFVNVTENKDNYIDGLKTLCDANKLNIHKMSADDIHTDANGLYCMTVNLELQGDLSHITDFITDVSESEMICRVATFSYRLTDNTFSWMRRSIDEQDVVGWWDISGVTDYLIQDEDPGYGKDDLDLLDANAFMRQGTALCYLRFEFIGTEV